MIQIFVSSFLRLAIDKGLAYLLTLLESVYPLIYTCVMLSSKVHWLYIMTKHSAVNPNIDYLCLKYLI